MLPWIELAREIPSASACNCSARSGAPPPRSNPATTVGSLAVELELVVRRVILAKTPDPTRIAESGRGVVLVVVRIGIRVVVDDAAAEGRYLRRRDPPSGGHGIRPRLWHRGRWERSALHSTAPRRVSLRRRLVARTPWMLLNCARARHAGSGLSSHRPRRSGPSSPRDSKAQPAQSKWANPRLRPASAAAGLPMPSTPPRLPVSSDEPTYQESLRLQHSREKTFFLCTGLAETLLRPVGLFPCIDVSVARSPSRHVTICKFLEYKAILSFKKSIFHRSRPLRLLPFRLTMRACLVLLDQALFRGFDDRGSRPVIRGSRVARGGGGEGDVSSGASRSRPDFRRDPWRCEQWRCLRSTGVCGVGYGRRGTVVAGATWAGTGSSPWKCWRSA